MAEKVRQIWRVGLIILPKRQWIFPISTRNKYKKYKKKYWSHTGFTEAELKVLDDPANGVVSRSEGSNFGKITNATIREIKEHLDGKKPVVEDTLSLILRLLRNLSRQPYRRARGYALAQGMNSNKLKPAGKRTVVSKAQIDKEAAKATAEDDYAKKAYEELARISDMFGDGEVDVNVAEAAIRAIANDDSITTPADDLIALRRHLDGLPDEFVEESVPPTEHTSTKEKIRARKSTLKKQFPGLTDDAAETMARSQVLSQGPETPIRGTGEAIGEAAKFTTAGLSNNGRIQDCLDAELE